MFSKSSAPLLAACYTYTFFCIPSCAVLIIHSIQSHSLLSPNGNLPWNPPLTISYSLHKLTSLALTGTEIVAWDIRGGWLTSNAKQRRRNNANYIPFPIR